jgi:fatty-acyl-CoA synthase
VPIMARPLVVTFLVERSMGEVVVTKELSELENHLLRQANLADFVKRSAQIFPNDVSMVCGDRELTYSELNDQVNQAANAFLDLGIERGDRVSIISHGCIEYLVLWFGLMKIGAIMNPINVLLKGGEVEYILNHAEPKFVVVEDALTPNVDEVSDKLSSVEGYLYINITGCEVSERWRNVQEILDGGYSNEEPLVQAGDYDPATLIYTSGTEAKPKGVLGTHWNHYVTTMHLVADLGIGKEDVLLLVAPLYHIAGIALCFTSIYMGGKLVINTFPDPMNIMEYTKNQKVTVWTFPPSTLAVIPRLPGFSRDIVESVTKILAFGSALPKAIAETWQEILPDVTMINYYGQTESGPEGTCSLGDDIIAHPGSIGKPHRTIEIKIFNDQDQEVPVGEVGEIVMRGPSIMAGYYKDEKKTRETLRNGWLHTADLAKKDEDGFYHFVDRKKDIIITGGENVSTLEVEQYLMSHDKVMEAAVIGLPHPRWGEAVVALVVPMTNETVTEDEIIAYCKSQMAGFKVPKQVFLVDEIPRNPSGKTIKSQLRQQFKDQLNI